MSYEWGVMGGEGKRYEHVFLVMRIMFVKNGHEETCFVLTSLSSLITHHSSLFLGVLARDIYLEVS
jgi:hypothetical protein